MPKRTSVEIPLGDWDENGSRWDITFLKTPDAAVKTLKTAEGAVPSANWEERDKAGSRYVRWISTDPAPPNAIAVVEIGKRTLPVWATAVVVAAFLTAVGTVGSALVKGCYDSKVAMAKDKLESLINLAESSECQNRMKPHSGGAELVEACIKDYHALAESENAYEKKIEGLEEGLVALKKLCRQ